MDEIKLSKIFEIMSFFDEARWKSLENSKENLINFFKDGLSNDTKLLTHWICYITDRQMDFQRIWDVGGFVFSELAHTIQENKDIRILDPENEQSFIFKVVNTKNGTDEKEEFKFQSKTNKNEIKECKKERLRKYYSKPEDFNGTVKFTSRYYPADYLSILYTLAFLEKYDFNLTKFIIKFYDKYGNEPEFIRMLLFAMAKITYIEVGQPQKDTIKNFTKNLETAKNRAIELEKLIFETSDDFMKKFEVFAEDTIYHQKRAWCALRDFLKSPEFRKYFIESLKEKNATNLINYLFDEKENLQETHLKQLELPGDVWNNNSKFRNCILSGSKDEKDKPLNTILRDFFKNPPITVGYPEQFDVTFDFVPRMCDKNNCNICPIGKIKGHEKNDFEKACVRNSEKFCSIAAIECGYKIGCLPENCKLLETLKS